MDLRDTEGVTSDSYTVSRSDTIDYTFRYLVSTCYTTMELKMDEGLLKRIASVDPGAALWIIENWGELEDRDRSASDLSELFTWHDTILGHEFWAELDIKVGRL